MNPVFFHVDMDAFYASIEQLDTPEYRGKPLIVGGRSGRGVVAACSYEARGFGVHSAMPIQQALRSCPQAIVVPVRMRRYQEVSRAIMAILKDEAPIVQAISIDEAFLDMTGTERLLGPPRERAVHLKERVYRETGLRISVGIATTRFIAKLASDVKKPDGLYHVPAGSEGSFVLTLPLRDLWGLGKRTRSRLERLGITTVAELREQRIEYLRGHFGESSGEFLYKIARGIDPGIYSGSDGERHSISAEETFENDIDAPEELAFRMLLLAEEVFHRSIIEDWRGPTVQVKYRFPPFETHTVSRTLSKPVESTEELASIGSRLLEAKRQRRPLRLIGIGIFGAQRDTTRLQGDLFSETSSPDGETRKGAIDPTIVALRKKFGHNAIGRAGTIAGHNKDGPKDRS